MHDPGDNELIGTDPNLASLVVSATHVYVNDKASQRGRERAPLTIHSQNAEIDPSDAKESPCW